MKRLLVAVLLVITAIALTGCQALALEEPISLGIFLKYLGTSAGIGVALSVVLEQFPFVKRYFDQIQDLELKRLVVLAFCVALPLAVLGLSTYLGYSMITPDTLFAAVQAGFAAFTISQITHGLIRK